MAGHPAHVTEFITLGGGANNSNTVTTTKTTTNNHKNNKQQQNNNKNNKRQQNNKTTNNNKNNKTTTIILPAPLPHSVEISASLQPMITPKRAGVVKYSPSNLIFRRLRTGCDTVYVKQVT